MRSGRSAMPFLRGCVADIWLKGRGIDLTDGEARSLKYAPDLWHWPTRTRWSAMLAPVTSAAGEELGVHQTFLLRDGSAKAPLGDKARLFTAGSRLRVGGGIWFGAADPAHEFVVAEGIESLLSALRLLGAAAGCAALSEGGIRRLILPPAAKRSASSLITTSRDKALPRLKRRSGAGPSKAARSRSRSRRSSAGTPTILFSIDSGDHDGRRRAGRRGCCRRH